MTDTVEVYEDSGGSWRWRRVAGNGEQISDGSEGYTRKADAQRAANRVNSDLVTEEPEAEPEAEKPGGRW